MTILARSGGLGALLLCTAFLFAPFAAAQAPQVTFRKPTAGQFVDDAVEVIVRVTGTYEIGSANASVSGITAPLSYSTWLCVSGDCEPGWSGTLDLSSLPRGDIALFVAATDTLGNAGSASIGLVHDRVPRLQVHAPKPLDVAGRRLAIDVTCTDDGPGGCGTVTASGGGYLLASGNGGLTAEIDATPLDGRGIDLNIDAVDGAGRTSRVSVPIYVDGSLRIRKSAQVPGEVWDADAQRILYWDLGSNLYIRDRATGADTLVHSGPSLAEDGLLTPVGAAFALPLATFPYNAARSWESGSVVDLGNLNSGSSLKGKGPYLIWNNGSDLFRRDVSSGSNVTVTSAAGNIDNDVAANGAVAYWTTGTYEISLYKPDGTTTPLTADETVWNTYPLTDGDSVVYRKHPTCCFSSDPRHLMLYRTGSHQLLGETGDDPRPGISYRIANGWVGFLKKGGTGVLQVWRMSPAGQQAQLSFFGASSWLDNLGDDGTLMYTNNGRRHLARPSSVSALKVNSSLGKTTFIGGVPHVAIGNSLFRIDMSAASTELNADGKGDVVWRHEDSGLVYRLFGNGAQLVQGAMVYQDPDTTWRIVGDGDFNGDGTSDLLWRNSVTGQVSMLFFAANGFATSTSSVYSEPNAAWKIVHTPDIDGDGRADLLWWNASTGQVYAMLMSGASIVAEGFVYHEPDTVWRIAATGDFSGSGKRNQLLWRNSTTGQVYLMTVGLSGGAFSWSGDFIYQEPNTAWKIVGAADFDGDGRTDILWRNDVTGQVYMMLMNGFAIASQRFVYQETNGAWKIAAHGDYDGDGKADILWRNDVTGQVYMMLMNGLAIASEAMVYHEPDTRWRLMGPAHYGQ